MTRFNNLSLILFFLSFILVSCERENNTPKDKVLTGDVSLNSQKDVYKPGSRALAARCAQV